MTEPQPEPGPNLSDKPSPTYNSESMHTNFAKKARLFVAATVRDANYYVHIVDMWAVGS